MTRILVKGREEKTQTQRRGRVKAEAGTGVTPPQGVTRSWRRRGRLPHLEPLDGA